MDIPEGDSVADLADNISSLLTTRGAMIHAARLSNYTSQRQHQRSSTHPGQRSDLPAPGTPRRQ